MKKINKRLAGVIIALIGINQGLVGLIAKPNLSSTLLGLAIFLIGYVFIQEKPEKKNE